MERIAEPLLVTLPTRGFLTVFFGGERLLRRRKVDMDGVAPIGRAVFVGSKYSILLVWAAMVAQGWGLTLRPGGVPRLPAWPALSLWVAGFALLFAGRFRLGSSFRVGSPRERTDLRTDGLYRFSRNPMYLGVYATLLAAVLYTLNPLVLAVGVLVAVVHHRIVLAEEDFLRRAFGERYGEYCRRVRRYL